jgi:hypothetical protein
MPAATLPKRDAVDGRVTEMVCTGKVGAGNTDGHGHTNVEEWLNGTSPREKIDYRNFANNVDTIS